MNYSIITPTKNEGPYIEQTIQSVITQDILPMEWCIMDDDSTDNTEEIVRTYLKDYPFIRYYKLPKFRSELTNTGGRVAAIINYADSLRTHSTDIIAKIDADTSFGKDFFSNMLNEFKTDSSLGIASGHLVENGIPEKISDRRAGRGASLIIRYTCFMQIGRFYESKTRGEDVLALVAARAMNWKTRTFDFYFNHLKAEGVRKSQWKNHLVTGQYKGSIPYWLPFFLGNIIRDLNKKPYFIGSLLQLYGYIMYCYISRYRPYPEFVSRQYRHEQKIKIKSKIGLS
jgi:glycosyltransferase involved in cell wall biosynthesis